MRQHFALHWHQWSNKLNTVLRHVSRTNNSRSNYKKVFSYTKVSGVNEKVRFLTGNLEKMNVTHHALQPFLHRQLFPSQDICFCLPLHVLCCSSVSTKSPHTMMKTVIPLYWTRHARSWYLPLSACQQKMRSFYAWTEQQTQGEHSSTPYQNPLQHTAPAMVTDRLSVSRAAAMIISMATLSKVAWQQSWSCQPYLNSNASPLSCFYHLHSVQGGR